jgi:RNA polymerase sigma factor (sigma-70 family)
MPSPASRVVQHLRQIFRGDMATLRDAQLLQRFADVQDEQAFAVLVHRHGPLVLGVCRRILQSVHDAEDAFQATFLVLARRASAIRKPDSLASWLYEVAYRLARKMKADACKRRVRETKVQPPAPVAPVDLTGRELQTILDEELQHLAAKYRQPLLLCYLEGLTQEEAAGQLGWPRGTLKRRLERGRELLKGQLSRRGLGLGAAIAVTLPAGEALALPVSATLGTNTSHAATLFATRQIVPAGLITGRVVALAEATLKTLLSAKLKILVLALTVAMVGAATLMWIRNEGSTPDQSAQAPARSELAQATAAPKAQLAAKQSAPLQLSVEVPKEKPTVSQFNGGQYQVTVHLKNLTDQDAVVWPYLTVKVLDGEGNAIQPSQRQGKYALRGGERSILEEMDFVTVQPGKAHAVQVRFGNLAMHDPEAMVDYQVPGEGDYILEVNYQYDRTAVKKRFGEGARDADRVDKPWNRAVEFEKKVEVLIRVMADVNDETPQARNRCPPGRQPAGDAPREIAVIAHTIPLV